MVSRRNVFRAWVYELTHWQSISLADFHQFMSAYDPFKCILGDWTHDLFSLFHEAF